MAGAENSGALFTLFSHLMPAIFSLSTSLPSGQDLLITLTKQRLRAGRGGAPGKDNESTGKLCESLHQNSPLPHLI